MSDVRKLPKGSRVMMGKLAFVKSACCTKISQVPNMSTIQASPHPTFLGIFVLDLRVKQCSWMSYLQLRTHSLPMLFYWCPWEIFLGFQKDSSNMTTAQRDLSKDLGTKETTCTVSPEAHAHPQPRGGLSWALPTAQALTFSSFHYPCVLPITTLQTFLLFTALTLLRIEPELCIPSGRICSCVWKEVKGREEGRKERKMKDR